MKNFSKIDINSLQRKVRPQKVPHLIKREVMSPEVSFFAREARKKLEVIEAVPIILSVPKRKKAKRSWKFERPQFARLQLVQMGSFAMAGLLLVFLLQGMAYLSSAKKASGEILGAATSAYSDLHSAGQNLGNENFASAKSLFDNAAGNIKVAQEKLNNFRALTWLAPQAKSADHILTGAGFLAAAGTKLTEALNLFDELKVSSKGVETVNFNDKMSGNRDLLAESQRLVLKATDEFNAVTSLPLDYAGTLETAKQQVSELNSILGKLVGLEDLYLGLFKDQKTYLLVFQNYDEARATGGFIGTYGILQTDRGSITKLKIESIYQLDGQIYEQIAAPGPMQPDIKRWGIRDANWFADFPTSAQKLLYFNELGGETADGVISLTPQLFEDLLRLTGPVEMNEYGVTLNADNFQQIAQFKTSVDYDRQLNQPKKFLADFAQILLNRLSNLQKDQWVAVFQIAQDNLKQKQILLYSKDTDVQAKISDLGFSGQVLKTDYDYLSIVHSNLGGTKTDLSMDQNVTLQSKILSDGSIINTLAIDRKNNSQAVNRDYLRILVPYGSQYVSSQGFDEYQHYDSVARDMKTDPDLAAWDAGEMHSNTFIRAEAGKTEFAGWLSTQSGEERTITVTYILPFKINAENFGQVQPYSLMLQKQSGSRPFAFSGELSLGRFGVKWLGPEEKQSGSKILFNSNTNTDDFWPLLISP